MQMAESDLLFYLFYFIFFALSLQKTSQGENNPSTPETQGPGLCFGKLLLGNFHEYDPAP